MTRESGSIALVTGGNRGIGLEVVRQLVKHGWKVYLGTRQLEAGQKASTALGGDSANVELVVLDVTDPQSVKTAVQYLDKHTGRLDVLVNNAGILDETPIERVDAETFFKILKTNTWGPLQMTQAFLPLLRKSKNPRVVNVSSGAGSLTEMGTYAPAYSISKTALNAVTRQLAGALKDIPVNAVCPGWVRTDMGGSEAPRSVAEGANTIVWLATEAPRTLTGQFLRDRKPASW